MLKKAAALLVVCAGIAPWIGCGTTTGHYLYAALPSGSELAAFREDPNSGILTLLSFSPVTAGPGVHAVVVHPSKKFLYAANSGEVPTGDVSLYTVSTGGVLTEITPRAQAGTTPSLMAIDSSGSYLYVGNTGSQDISVFSIDGTTGVLSAVPQQAGAPTARLGLAPLNMTLAPGGNVLYVTGAGSPGYIEVFSITAGVLSFVEVVQPGANPYGLVIDPTGKYLYTANFSDNTISEYTIASDGTLTEISGSPIGETYSSPASLLIDKSGKFLFVANSQSSGNVAAYTIGSDGGLLVLGNSPFTTIANPSVLASDPSGHYIFVGSQSSSSSIESFSLNTSNGTLTQVATYPIGNSTTSIAVLP